MDGPQPHASLRPVGVCGEDYKRRLDDSPAHVAGLQRRNSSGERPVGSLQAVWIRDNRAASLFTAESTLCAVALWRPQFWNGSEEPYPGHGLSLGPAGGRLRDRCNGGRRRWRHALPHKAVGLLRWRDTLLRFIVIPRYRQRSTSALFGVRSRRL